MAGRGVWRMTRANEATRDLEGLNLANPTPTTNAATNPTSSTNAATKTKQVTFALPTKTARRHR